MLKSDEISIMYKILITKWNKSLCNTIQFCSIVVLYFSIFVT